jgi:hypothetical protein
MAPCMAGIFSVFVLLSLIVKLSEWVGAHALEAKRVAELNVSEHRGAQRAIGDSVNGGGHQDGDSARSPDRYVLPTLVLILQYAAWLLPSLHLSTTNVGTNVGTQPTADDLGLFHFADAPTYPPTYPFTSSVGLV